MSETLIPVQALSAYLAGQPLPAAWEQAWPLIPAAAAQQLTAEFVASMLDLLGMDPAARAAVEADASEVVADPVLQHLAAVYHALLFAPAGTAPEDISQWPDVHDRQGRALPCFRVLPLLLEIPPAQQRMAQRGIPAAILLAGLEDIQLWMQSYRQKHGTWGFDNPKWLSGFLKGRTIRLGRLQFALEQFGFEHTAWQNQADGRVVMLAPGGMAMRADGQFDVQQTGGTGLWQSEFSETDTAVLGNPVSPLGYVLQSPSRLDKAQWRCVLRKDDPTLGIHIRAEGPMDHALCGAAIAEALSFFPRYYPEHAFRALTCLSWLLDPQLELYLKPDSNIVQFLREFYLFPSPWGNDAQIFNRVFGRRFDGCIDTAPQRTSVERAVVAHVKAGGQWRTAGGCLFVDGLQWGSQSYR